MIRDEIKNIKSTKKDLRNFGLVVGGAALALGALLAWKGRPAAPYAFGIGAALVISGLIAPRVLRPLQRPWMALSVVMGWVMTRLILGALYFLGFASIRLLARISGKRFLEHGGEGGSYWNRRDSGEVKQQDMDRQF